MFRLIPKLLKIWNDFEVCPDFINLAIILSCIDKTKNGICYRTRGVCLDYWYLVQSSKTRVIGKFLGEIRFGFVAIFYGSSWPDKPHFQVPFLTCPKLCQLAVQKSEMTAIKRMTDEIELCFRNVAWTQSLYFPNFLSVEHVKFHKLQKPNKGKCFVVQQNGIATFLQCNLLFVSKLMMCFAPFCNVCFGEKQIKIEWDEIATIYKINYFSSKVWFGHHFLNYKHGYL